MSTIVITLELIYWSITIKIEPVGDKYMATIKDVARISGYSLSAVSYALNNHPSIPESTRQRIQAVANELKYVPNKYAQRLKGSHKQIIGVFINDLSGPIHGELMNSLSLATAKTGYDLMLIMGKAGRRILTSNMVDAAIIISHLITDDDIRQAVDRYRIPTMVLDRHLDYPHVSEFLMNNGLGIELMFEQLINRGRKHIAFLSGNPNSLDNLEREQAYLNMAQKHRIKPMIYHGDFTEASGAYVFENHVLPQISHLDALICSNDEMAIGCIKVANNHQISIPTQLAISGFDNIALGEYVTPHLTTVDANRSSWGTEIIQELVRLIESPELAAPIIRHRVQLVIRGSI